MPFFCVLDHPKLPLTVIRIVKKRDPTGKDGFRERFVAPIDDNAVPGAESVIEMIDEAMGKATKARGVYQAPYADVRAVYDDIIGPHMPRPPSLWLRIPAGVTAIALMIAMCVITVWVTLFMIVFGAARKQSGFSLMFETHMMASIFDWRPLIKRLLNYAKGN